MARTPAILVVDAAWPSQRFTLPLDDDEVPIDGEDVDPGRLEGPMAIVAWRDGAWHLRPCSQIVMLDDVPVVEETVLHHGQRIGIERMRFRFLAGDPERSLDEERFLSRTIDGLTGLLHRRHAAHNLERQQPPTATLMIDIDWMKKINDTYGFTGGDLVLVRTAQRIRDHVQRWPECAVRVGGEEFVVILPGATLEQARARAEQLRAAAEAPIMFEEHPITATLSIGLAMHAGDVDETMRTADENLMLAKQQGRNRVVG